MEIKKLLGKRLKEIRELHGLTQEELAEMISMSSISISKVERGTNFISVHLLEKLCTFYNADPSYFFNFNIKNVNNDFEKIKIITKKLKTLSTTDLYYIYKFIENL